jgi:hypothetical protein
MKTLNQKRQVSLLKSMKAFENRVENESKIKFSHLFQG